MMAISCLTAA